jgi:hypothetical protein
VRSGQSSSIVEPFYNPVRDLGMSGVSQLIGGALSVGLLAGAPDVDQLRDQLDAYLLDYQPRLSGIIATESISQEVEPAVAVLGRASVVSGARRTIRSEISFGTLPGDLDWLGFRRVQFVNGRPVPNDGPTTDDLLRKSEHRDAAQALLQQGARHNLGTFRNTNLPNLPLELLHPRHRRRFSHALGGTARINGTTTTILVALEHQTPSIIRGTDGANILNMVTAWVDASGRLLQAEARSHMAVAYGMPAELRLLVKFDLHKELGLLVPVEMREVFWSDADQRQGKAVARYRDFRRFETSVRIVPPK